MNTQIKTKGIAAAVAAVALMGASAASAATFDFVSMADNAGDANYIGGTELNWSDTAFAAGLTIDGITLVASGSNVDNNGLADAFFDKGNAGLGVCSSNSCATGVQGAITSDDNVSGMAGGETLTLDFGEIVDITSITFFQGHNSLLTGSLGLNGGTLVLNAGVITSGASLLSGASMFDFSYTGDEFYIATATAVSAVPLPAGVALLLTGLAGLGVAGRRKKTTA